MEREQMTDDIKTDTLPADPSGAWHPAVEFEKALAAMEPAKREALRAAVHDGSLAEALDEWETRPLVAEPEPTTETKDGEE